MIKPEYIEYRGKKYPLALTVDAAMAYMNATGEDFNTTLINSRQLADVESIRQYKAKMAVMLAYMLEEGAELMYPKWKVWLNMKIFNSKSGFTQDKVLMAYKFCHKEYIEAVEKFIYFSKTPTDASTGEEDLKKN